MRGGSPAFPLSKADGTGAAVGAAEEADSDPESTGTADALGAVGSWLPEAVGWADDAASVDEGMTTMGTCMELAGRGEEPAAGAEPEFEPESAEPEPDDELEPD